MKSGIVKRSIVLAGHKTSVSLENEFWDGLHRIAEQQEKTVPALLQQIDRGRNHANMSSAIRTFVLEQFRAQAVAARPAHSAGAAVRPAAPAQSLG
jgi:predicted DNA-binding ribbon-helix-helix protein